MFLHLSMSEAEMMIFSLSRYLVRVLILIMSLLYNT